MTATPASGRVARLTAVGALELRDEPLPFPAPGSSLVRVTAVGLCGSDIHWFREGSIGDAALVRPLVLGHEVAGTIEGGPRRGQRVAVDPAIPCGSCPSCRRGHGHLCPTVRFAGHGSVDGGLRDYLVWPDEQLHPLPESISDVAGAVLEPLGVAMHALDLSHVQLGAAVAVVGCGPIGLLLLQLLRSRAVDGVLAVEPLEHRRTAAAAAGADLVLAPDDVADDGIPATLLDPPGGPALSAGYPAEGADVVFEVTGSVSAVETALRLARPGGRVVLVGIPEEDRTMFPASLARRKGLTLVLSRRMGAVYPRAVRLVARGLVDLESVVTHRFGLDEVATAFPCAVRREGLKVVVQPPLG